MKTGLKRILAIAFFVVTISLPAHATIVAQWTFETNTPADSANSASIGSIAADIGSGTASGTHASSNTDWSTPAGNGSANSLSSNEWAVGDFYQFQFNTTGYSGLTLTFDHTSSGTGPGNFKIQTSTNGMTFVDLLNYSVLANAAPNPVWNSATSSALYTISSSLPVSLENVTTAYVRLTDLSITSANGGTVANTGTSRVDNITISAVPEPGAILFGTLICGVIGIVAGGNRLKQVIRSRK